MRCVDAVSEWEERVRDHHRACGSLTRSVGCYPDCLHPTGLSGSDSYGGAAGGGPCYEDNRVGLHLGEHR